MQQDALQTFIFDGTDVRGAIVTIDNSFETMTQGAFYSTEQQKLLGQFCAANLLLTSHLKFDGLLSIQARGAGPVTMVMSETTHQLGFRGLVQGDVESANDLQELLGKATLAITVEPKNGQRYQGIVPLEHAGLGACLQSYFEQSEQLPSWFRFSVSENKVRGVMLQALPADGSKSLAEREEDWARLTHLASTLTDAEMLELDNETLLHRLYHEETVRLFDPKPVAFVCSCSRERMERGILTLGENELNAILEESGKVETDCHFCHTHYAFSAADIRALIDGNHYQKSH